MTSAVSCAPFNRLPNPLEIEEMVKYLVITYPCLRDAETGHVSIHAFSQNIVTFALILIGFLIQTFTHVVFLYGVVFKQLKKRLSNTQLIKKRQGPCEKKRKLYSGSKRETKTSSYHSNTTDHCDKDQNAKDRSLLVESHSSSSLNSGQFELLSQKTNSCCYILVVTNEQVAFSFSIITTQHFNLIFVLVFQLMQIVQVVMLNLWIQE